MSSRVTGVVLIYALFAAGWILFSDSLVALLLTDPEYVLIASTLKGWAFVGVTSLLLWGLLRRFPGHTAQAEVEAGSLRTVLPPFAFLALGVVALGAAGVVMTVHEHSALEGRRLEAVADLKVGQITRWLDERRADALAAVAQANILLPRETELRSQDLAAQAKVTAFLEGVRRPYRYQRVALLDMDGRVVLSSDGDFEPAAPLRDAVRLSLREGRPIETPFYRAGDQKDAVTSLDFVAPLRSEAGTAPMAIVLQADPESELFKYVQDWPAPSRTAETLLLRRDGADLQSITPLRHGTGAALGDRIALSRTDMLGVIVAENPARRGVAITARDYRGEAVLGVGRDVPGSEWLLVVKVDEAELYDESRSQVLWISAAAAFALFSTVGVGVWLSQRRALLLSLQREEAQGRQLRELQLLDAIAEGSRDLMYAKGLDGRYTFLNRAYCQLHGLASADMLGKTDEALFPPAKAERARQAELQAVAAGVEFTREEVLDTPGGARVMLTTRGPLFGIDGRPAGVFGIARDITALRQDQEALRAREEIYSAIVNQAVDGMVLLDLQTLRFTEFNDAACAGLGYSRDEFARLTLRDIKPPDLIDETEARIEALRRGEQLPPFASRHRCADGSVRDVELSYRALDIRGRRYLAGVWRDTTATRATDEQLRKLSQALAQSRVSVIITNTDGIVEYVNQAFADSSGYSIAESLGQRAGFLRSGQTPRETYVSLWSALRAGQAWEGEFYNLRRDGRVVVEFARISPVIQADGRTTHYLSVQEDITERKRAEAELARYRDQLEERVAERTRQLEAANRVLSERSVELEAAREASDMANRAKSVFLANMSHEIRTPMNAIIGLTHLLRRSVSGDEAQGRLVKVGDAAEHLLTIINDILDISKIEAGRLTLDETDFRLEDVVRKACALIADKAGQKGLEVVVDVADVPDMLRGDSTRLSQMLLNYLGNAVKFTEKGMVLLRARIDAEDETTLQLRFEIVDTGIGIEPEALARLFRPFEQADASTTRRFGGTGLGLAITAHLARLMGGEAGADSILGQGSRFWFTVRLARNTAAARAAYLLPSLRVLVVDDLWASRDALGAILRALGARVALCASQAEALALLKAADAGSEPFELVLLDAGINGLDDAFVDCQAVLHGLTHVPRCILLPVGDDSRARERAWARGVAGVLPKPVTLSSLHGSILSVLRRGAGPDTTPVARLPDDEATLVRIHHGERVLLVEDSPINQEVAVSLLESAGLRVDLAGNGAEAVEKACATDYDLILMDMQMPVMDGLEATQAIRRSGRTQVPIVAMTANAFGEDRQRCLDAGMNDHLPKPVDPAMLYSKLLQWLPEGQAVADAPAAPAAGTDIRSLLDQVPGLDAAYGLKNLRGRVPNYLRLLRKYADGHADDGGRIRAGLAAGNMDEVRRLAHSLKGVAGMIGATGAQGLAAELEAAIREALDAATIEARLAAVEEAQAATVAAIYRLPDADAVAAAQDAAASAAAPDEAAQAAAAEETLRRIEALLGEGNVLVMKQAREAAPLIRSALGDAAAGFEQALAAYDFPAALACLRSRKP